MLQTELARKQVDRRAELLEDREINDELETFMFDNCMSVQEQLYPLVKLWPVLFRNDI